MAEILIIGCGGFGREVAALLSSHTTHSFRGFADDNHPPDSNVLGWGPVLGPVSAAPNYGPAVIAIGDPKTRHQISKDAVPVAAPWIAHENSWIGPLVDVNDGTIICSGVSITTNIHIGVHVHLNLHCTVGHDTRIGDYVTVSPGVCISGNAEIGDRVEIGTSASILPGVRIGADAVVGAGAVVTRDVAPGSTVVGVPARPI